MAATKKYYIPVGSGDMYYKEFNGTIPEDSDIEKDDNRIGYIKDGATITYSPTSQSFKDDLGIVSRSVITAEEAKLAGNLIAWSSADMPVFIATARVTENAKNGTTHRVIKIGGMNNDNKKVYCFRFVHKDAEYGDVRITIVGRSQAEISLTYKQDDSSQIALEVTAQSQDSEGTLILYDEDTKVTSA